LEIQTPAAEKSHMSTDENKEIVLRMFNEAFDNGSTVPIYKLID